MATRPTAGPGLFTARVLTCVYCGHEYPQHTPAAGSQVLTDHINLCEKHPLYQARRDIALLRTVLGNAIGGAHTEDDLRGLEVALRTTPCDANVKALFGEAIHALLATMPKGESHAHQA